MMTCSNSTPPRCKLQKGKNSAPRRTVVLHRPIPFSTSPASRADGTRRRRHRRRSSNAGGDDATADDGGNDDGGIVRAQPHALQAFRFLCRSGQLFLAEQLAAAGIWDTDSNGDGRGGAASANAATDVAHDDNEESGGDSAISRKGAKEGLRTAWMAARLKPAMRKELKERRERVRRALEDIRRLAGSRGTIFVLPRVGIETGGAAAEGWDLRPVPSQREVIRGARSLQRGGGV